ncbi:MAG: hypothetical protein K0Q51_119 [Rickettsiaceae bacterium]|jgi:hypothetical protein|nr:hypothetical protein [Rickettsiaceae bacterium]
MENVTHQKTVNKAAFTNEVKSEARGVFVQGMSKTIAKQ